ncbi:MAG: YaiI/YqxD family protein [Gammaproteobacteria bacterium]
MHIWVDADACPAVVRDILVRAAERTQTALTFVSNQAVRVPLSPVITTLRVSAGFDAADDAIVARLDAGDLVVTADIPLAAEALARGAHALNPRGEIYSDDTIRAKRAMRDFMDTMRSSGLHSGGPPPFGKAERKAFADALDRLLARRPQGGR